MLSGPNTSRARQRLIHREDRRLWFEIDADVPPGFLEHVPIRVGQQHNRLFGVIDAIGGQARLIVDDEGNAIDAGNVSGRDDGQFVPGNAGPNSMARNAASDGLRTVTPYSMPGRLRSST